MPTDVLLAAAEAGDAEAQFELGREQARLGDFTRAREWFERAADLGSTHALTELGVFEMYSLDRTGDCEVAAQRFETALAAGNAEAGYHLAVIELGDRVRTFDAQRCIDRLAQAAQADFAPALRCVGMAWAALGDASRAGACLLRALGVGDAVASYLLARLSGNPAQADLFYRHAIARGVMRARAFAAGPGPAPPVARVAWPGTPDASCLAPSRSVAEVHREQPFIATYDDVLSALDCEYVIALAADQLEPSQVFDPVTGEPIRHPRRTSSSMAFSRFDDDAWLRVLQRRLTTLAGYPLSHAEPFAVLRYGPGEQYLPHRDYLNPAVEAHEFAPEAPGQRLRTAFSYLNDVEAGGGTAFPVFGIDIEPRRGRVVLFDNMKPDGRPDPDTLHAGSPVERGEKWLGTLWLRERALRTF